MPWRAVMQLYWVRHGQMDLPTASRRDLGSVNRFFNQEVGRGLSPLGREQAQRVAAWFRREPPAAIYSSPLERARETAEHTAQATGLEPVVRSELQELRTGALRPHGPEARIVASIAGTRALGHRSRRTLLGATAIPVYYWSWRLGRTEGGESRAELHDRLERLFAELRAEYPADARIALFAHGYLMFHMVRHLARRGGLRFEVWRRPYIPHGAITEMTLDASGPPRLVRYADTGHLTSGS